MKRLLLIALGLLVTSSAFAVPLRLEFTADGFQNSGTQHPGFAGPLSGSFSWDGNLGDPIAAFTGVNFNLYGHLFTLAEIGIANQGTTQTAFGGTARGANAVVGDGAVNDFLIVFDRFTGGIAAFAYSIQGKTSAIWWTPARVDSRIVADIAAVPEPSAIALLAVAALGMGFVARRRA